MNSMAIKIIKSLTLYKVAISFSLLFAFTFSINAQEIVKTVDSETYDKALDEAFPMQFDEGPLDYGYLIRVRTGFEAEFLIKIAVHNNQTTITKYESLNENLYNRFSEIYGKEDIDDPEELAKRVKLKKETKIFSNKEFSKLRSEFADKTTLTYLNVPKNTPYDPVNKSEIIIIHGTYYEVKFYNSRYRGSLIYNVYDYSLKANTFDSPIVFWIKDVVKFYNSKK